MQQTLVDKFYTEQIYEPKKLKTIVFFFIENVEVYESRLICWYAVVFIAMVVYLFLHFKMFFTKLTNKNFWESFAQQYISDIFTSLDLLILLTIGG